MSVRRQPGFRQSKEFNALVEDKVLENSRFVKSRGHRGYGTGVEVSELDGNRARVGVNVAGEEKQKGKMGHIAETEMMIEGKRLSFAV